VREDGTALDTPGACVAYAARGGELAPPERTWESVCEDEQDGSFSTSVNPFNNTIVWRCDWFDITFEQWLAFGDTLDALCPGPTAFQLMAPRRQRLLELRHRGARLEGSGAFPPFLRGAVPVGLSESAVKKDPLCPPRRLVASPDGCAQSSPSASKFRYHTRRDSTVSHELSSRSTCHVAISRSEHLGPVADTNRPLELARWVPGGVKQPAHRVTSHFVPLGGRSPWCRHRFEQNT
jgi:hypothetical protein